MEVLSACLDWVGRQTPGVVDFTLCAGLWVTWVSVEVGGLRDAETPPLDWFHMTTETAAEIIRPSSQASPIPAS